MERSKNRQLAINMGATFVTFFVGLGISFLLTPYIVNRLGAAAYGFVGLSSNIIDYTTLLTMALNSMAGRFITICYTKGDVDNANKYFSSVFYANIVVASAILIMMGCCLVYLEKIFEIPLNLITDVKLLFSLLVLNSLIGLLTNIYAIATFIKNRLELSSIRQIVGNLIRAVAIVLLFGFLPPHIWYIGLAGLILTLYTSYTNYRFTRYLTPELRLCHTNFEISKVNRLISSGIWNTFNKLGVILGQGLDLVIANLFIGATAMGIFSISKQIPFIIIGMCGAISGVFAPPLTRLYAENNVVQFKNEINKAIRILGFATIAPLSFIYVYGDKFYELWMPSQNCNQLYLLSILCALELSLSLPLEVIWNVFTISNKLKVSSIFLFCNHLISFLIVLTGMYLVEDVMLKLIILASTRTILGIVRSLTFLPMYGAYCVGLPLLSFYQSVFKSFIATAVTCVILSGTKYVLNVDSWNLLIVSGVITCVVALCVSGVIVLSSADKAFLMSKIQIPYSPK